jgi:hypothetical protein
MSTHREEIFKIRGEGTLKPKNNDTIEIPVEFACYQYSDGNIEGTIKLLEKKHLRSEYIDHKEYNLSAKLENGERLYIENLRTRFASWQPVDNLQSLWTDVRFDAFGLRLEGREFLSNRTKKYCKFGVSNIYSHEKPFGIDIGDVTPVMDENQWEIWEYIRDRKISCVTGYIQICLDEEIKLNSVEGYKSELYEKIRRILLLTSLAKGTRVDWAYFELFEQIDEKSYERIYSERRTISNKYTDRELIVIPPKLHEYLETTYPNYTDNFDRDTRFDFAIHWYLESFLTNNIESMYIKLFTALEALVFGFVSFKKCENIFNTEEDFKKFRKQLKEQMKPLLKDLNMDETKRASIYGKLEELDRYPFKTNLEIFLTEHHIEFNDLIDDLGSLIKCRNEIIHSGSIERITSTELIDEYYKLLPLIQRIFRSLLKYDGEY